MRDRVIEIITKHVDPARHYLITPEAHLADLHLCQIERMFSIPVDIEEALGLPMFSDAEIESWVTVGDVVRAVEAVDVDGIGW